MRCRSFISLGLLGAGACLLLASPLAQTPPRPAAPLTSPEERAALHRSTDWLIVAPHLPDPETASAAQLETAADVLRARRFPEDSLDYYGYAMARGGNVSELLNKMGVVRLELRQVDLAREMFRRTVSVQKKNAVAWNNLGVTEFSIKNYGAAIGDYKRASKLDRSSAVYHANMGMAYFESKDLESARAQFAAAVKLDPQILLGRRDDSGSIAHVVNTENYGELCFQMALLYARDNKSDAMRLWLGKAAEAGYNVRDGLRSSTVLAVYRKDPDLLKMLANTDRLRAKNTARLLPAGAVPSLGASREQVE